MSGFCADGYCCDTVCNGTCQACAAALKYSGAANGTCDTAKDGRGGAFCAPPNATCDGDHTTTGVDGVKKDCSPYKCESNGACRFVCASVNDCVAPTICDSSGKCVSPAATGSDGGCALSPGRVNEGPGLASLAMIAGLALVRRRRR
jgi:hypothetical protein